MPEVHILAVLAGAVAAFGLGATYYGVLGERPAEAGDGAAATESFPPWKVAVELVRCLILAAVVAGLAAQSEIGDWTGGVLLGVALWVGFPVVLWTGATIHENTPWRAAAIHAGDWLVKLIVVGAIVAVWQ